MNVFSRFTASARRVMQRAFREAKRWQHDFVGTEHLLYGLLCDADGPAVALLRSLHARPELLLQKVELSLQQHDAGMAMEQFPLSPASRRAFHAAAEDAEHFSHQMIGPEHLLLGLLRDSECEAAQILAAHGVAWEAARNAVAQIPADTYREAQIQANEKTRVALGVNPSADELERWIAPPITHEDVTESNLTQLQTTLNQALTNPYFQLEAQLRITQLALGCVMGYAFGHWLAGWMMGSVMAMAGIGVASFRNSRLGVFTGIVCGLFITPLFESDLSTPLRPVFMGLLGGFLGSFLGDAWRFSRADPVQQPPPPETSQPDEEPSHDAIENRQRNGLRSRQ